MVERKKVQPLMFNCFQQKCFRLLSVLFMFFKVGRMFPQAVYFPIRTLYLTLKMEQRERVKAADQASPAHPMQPQTPGNSHSTGEVFFCAEL